MTWLRRCRRRLQTPSPGSPDRRNLDRLKSKSKGVLDMLDDRQNRIISVLQIKLGSACCDEIMKGVPQEFHGAKVFGALAIAKMLCVPSKVSWLLHMNVLLMRSLNSLVLSYEGSFMELLIFGAISCY
ncbi:hypothetical protein MUK42_24948 [Musa troglodytarum]|uniref:Uncharacterized protein n=1 Tax=Musa troglodytarum TaxID=320322 RepID=A0A9E7IC72_9LILI|nr:hypothetical protein MUK42_24948 [Musa troglodytarum]